MELNMYQDEISQTIPIAIMVKELPAQVAVRVEEATATIEWSAIVSDVLWGVYVLGLLFFGWRLLRSLYRIYSLNANGRNVDLDGSKVVYTQSEHLPFSFWDRVYISDQVELTEDFRDILEHERTHVKSRHSIDVLLIEVIQITFWFNPMIYLYKTALRQTHEYLADAAVLEHTSRQTYGTMLLKQSLSGLEIALTHQFFHSHIKKRINMMYQKKSGRSAWLKYALALPVLFLLTMVFANRSSDGIVNSDLSEIVLNNYDESKLTEELTSIIEKAGNDQKEIARNIQKLIKSYLHEYPNNHKEIMGAMGKSGWEHGFMITSFFDQDNLDKPYFKTYPIIDINSLSIQIRSYNRHSLSWVKTDEDHNVITKENIKELLDVLYTRKFDHPEALEDYIKFSYSHRRNPTELQILQQRYREVLAEEKLDLYDDFDKVQITVDEKLPKELLSIKDIDLDDSSMPVIWSQEYILSQSINEFVDVNKPIGAIYYLPPSEATKIFGNKGSKGFYALMGYDRPITHPQKQKELLDFEVDNFFKTLANDVNEKDWVERLKKIHKKMQERYPKVLDWVTPFTTKAHKYNINLVIKDKEIIAAYRDGVERIDEAKDDKLLDENIKLDDLHSETSRSTQKDKDYKIADDIPLFPGCEDAECSKEALLKYLYSNVRYPSSMRANLIQGKAYLEIYIDEYGSMVGYGIYGSIEPDVVMELKKLYEGLQEKGQWKPRLLKGKPVKTSMLVPVTFRLQDEQGKMIDYTKSTSIIPQDSDVIFDEILVVGYPNQVASSEVPEMQEPIEYDTVIVYDPETYTETMTITPKEEGSEIKVEGSSDNLDLDPTIFINGKEYKGSIEDIDVNTIKEVNVSKGDDAKQKYGVNGENGVVEIVLKDGVKFNQIEMDTLIIFDPDKYTEKMIIRPQLDEDFEITLRYKNEQVTLTSDHAAWTDLTFSLGDGESQIVDHNGMADHQNHETKFSFEIIKDGNQFTFRNNHGFKWVEMQTNCRKWIYSRTEIRKSEVEINCF